MNAAIIAGIILLPIAIAVGLRGMKNLLEWKSNAWCAAAWILLLAALAFLAIGVRLSAL